ncbi:unnamed protein product [Owenia fusiformis]|uniref:m7GpppX diphosphatase n=1 Tax=Owenia fusiformis TaxID=6347 RepID=A0A8S4NTA0_OWEFU|nr:unnamed protein product [Owenia fusiformis]
MSNSGTKDEIPQKKMRMDQSNINSHESDILESLQGFKVEKILNENAQTKTMFVHGKFENSEDNAVVIVEKTAFSEKSIRGVLSGDTTMKNTLKNDIYGTYEVYPKPEFNEIKTTVIYPATEKHIAKYTGQPVYMVQETPELYSDITLPYLNAENFSIQWVYNILEKKKESERIIYEDSHPETGFILLPDMKWDQKQTDNLYLIAICHKRGIKSLRDLNSSHLPLLRNILTRGKKAIKDTFDVDGSQLRIYIHYQPSYYHFHVHFTHLKFDAPGSNAGRAHLLSDVIDNIELRNDFYQKKTLNFILRENEGLFKKFQESGKVLDSFS